MGLDVLNDPICSEESNASEYLVDGCQPNKQKRGKVPKKVVKSKRERLKREQLNEHFSKLAGVLEFSQENDGKASILNETIRLLKEMISQIQTLEKENATLLSESQYMTAEKNELKNETTLLEEQIEKIQNEMEERLSPFKPGLSINPPECWQSESPSHFMDAHESQMPNTNSSHQPPILGSLYVVPMNLDLQALQKAKEPANPPITVSKPYARYPAPADSWPLQLLSKPADAPIRQMTP